MIPFWALFGFYEPGEVAAAPFSASTTPFALWVYLLGASFFFANLLIAVISGTYQEIQKDVIGQWAGGRSRSALGYRTVYPVPPPLNVPALLIECAIRLLYLLFCRCRCGDLVNRSKQRARK